VAAGLWLAVFQVDCSSLRWQRKLKTEKDRCQFFLLFFLQFTTLQ